MAFKFFPKKKRKDVPEDQAPESPSAPDPSEETPKHPEMPADPADASPEAPTKKVSQRLRNGLAKTRDFLTTDVNQIFGAGQKIDENTLNDLEELLVTSDIGIQPATELIESLSREKDHLETVEQVKQKLKEKILQYLENSRPPKTPPSSIKPYIIMVVGVNGVGKTTTIGKLAAQYTAAGKKVMLVAADTFRAAAIDQLAIWAERTEAEIVRHKENSDPAAVVFDGVEAALARNTDVVLIDTAGRLHTKVNLMAELQKIQRTITKKIPDAPHEVLLVLDATTGQNALSQARQFSEATGVTGLALTKLDGTAKGGIVINLCHTLNIPLTYIGVGEQVADLQKFDPKKFVNALF